MSLGVRVAAVEGTFTSQRDSNVKFNAVIDALEVDRSKFRVDIGVKLDALKEEFHHRHTLLLEGSNHRFGLQSSENSRNVEALKVLQAYNNELEAKISIMARRVKIVEVEIDIKPPVGVDGL